MKVSSLFKGLILSWLTAFTRDQVFQNLATVMTAMTHGPIQEFLSFFVYFASPNFFYAGLMFSCFFAEHSLHQCDRRVGTRTRVKNNPESGYNLGDDWSFLIAKTRVAVAVSPSH